MDVSKHSSRLVVVTGMHRSGTSAVAGTLNLLGCALPGGLFPPVAGDNETGFWESQRITDIHDRALASAGISWDVPYPLSAAWFKSIHRIRMEDEITDFLSTELKDGPPLVIKDPRICHLLPLWRSAATRLKVDLRCVIPFRHPLEVAASLLRRNQTPTPTAMSLWFLHITAALHYSQDLPRVIISFPELLAQPRNQARNLIAALELDPYVGPGSLDAVEAFISPSLRHHHESGVSDQRLHVVPDTVNVMYQALLQVWTAAPSDPALRQALQHASEAFFTVRDLYGASFPGSSPETRHQTPSPQLEDAESELRRLQTLLTQFRHRQIAQTAALRGMFGMMSTRLSHHGGRRAGPTTQESGETAAQAHTVIEPSLFDVAFYLAQRLPLGVPMADARRDYEAFGRAIGLSPHPVFQPGPLPATALDESTDDRSQVPDYGSDSGFQDHIPLLFDYKFYCSQLDAPVKTVEEAVLHYCTDGSQRGLQPHPLFDTQFYVQQNPDIGRERINPLIHFLLYGEQERRDPHPLFSVSFYLDHYSTQLPTGVNALVHYLTEGFRRDFDPHPLFSNAYYRRQLVAAKLAQENPLIHFVTRQDGEQFDPNPYFSNDYYRLANRDVVDRGVNPLTHFVLEGAQAGRKPHLLVNPEAVRKQLSGGESLSVELLARSIETGSSSDYIAVSKELSKLPQPSWEPPTRPPVMQSIPHDRLEEIARSLHLPSPAMPLVSIIVAARNQPVLTLECLTSIAVNTAGANYEVILIDDGSDDPGVRRLSSVPGLRYFRNDRSAGYLLSVRRGSEIAKGRYLVFLNNDTQVQPGWLEGLLEVFDRRPDAGVVGPKLVFPDGRLQQAGVSISMDRETRFVGVDGNAERDEYSFERRVDYCSGTCLMVERVFYHGLGGFDDDYSPGYWEDVDFCFAARAEGRNTYFSPKSRVVHHLNASRKESPHLQDWAEIAGLNQERFFTRRASEIRDLLRITVIGVGALLAQGEPSMAPTGIAPSDLDLALLGCDAICIPWEPWRYKGTAPPPTGPMSHCLQILDTEAAARYMRNIVEKLDSHKGGSIDLDSAFSPFDRPENLGVHGSPVVVINGRCGPRGLRSFVKDFARICAVRGSPLPYMIVCTNKPRDLSTTDYSLQDGNAFVDMCLDDLCTNDCTKSTGKSALTMYLQEMLRVWATPRPGKTLMRAVPSPLRHLEYHQYGGRFEAEMGAALYQAWLTAAFEDIALFNHGQERMVFLDLTGFSRSIPGNEHAGRIMLKALQSVCAAYRLPV